MEKRYMSVSLKDMRSTTNKNSYKRYLTYIPSPSVSVGERIGYGAAGTVLGLGQGIASAAEGIADFVAGGVLQLFGQKEAAKEIYENSWSGDFREWIGDTFNPDDNKAMNTYLDVMGGIGNAGAQIGLAIGTGGLAGAAGAGATAISMVPLFMSASGSGTSEAVQMTGKLGAGENIYGILTGGVELGTEALLGGGGKILKAAGIWGDAGSEAVKSISKHAVIKGMLSNAGGEFMEEATASLASVGLKRVTGVDPNASVDMGEIVRDGAMGATVGLVLGFGNSAHTAYTARNTGRKITAQGEEAVKATVAEATALIKNAKATTDTDFLNMDAVARVEKALELYTEDTKASQGKRDYYLGEMSRGLAEVGMYATAHEQSKKIVSAVAAGGENAQMIIDGANAMFEANFGRKLTAEDFADENSVGTRMLSIANVYTRMFEPTDAEYADATIRNNSAVAFNRAQAAEDLGRLEAGKGSTVYKIAGDRYAVVTKRQGDNTYAVGFFTADNTSNGDTKLGIKTEDELLDLIEKYQASDKVPGAPSATESVAQNKEIVKGKEEKAPQNAKERKSATKNTKQNEPAKQSVSHSANTKKTASKEKTAKETKENPKTERVDIEDDTAVKGRLKHTKYQDMKFTKAELDAARADFKAFDSLPSSTRANILVMRRTAAESDIPAATVKGLTRMMAAYDFRAVFDGNITSKGFWVHGKELLCVNPFKDPYQSTFGHELAHRVEDYKGYKDFAEKVRKMVGEKIFKRELEQYRADYKVAAKRDGLPEISEAELEREALANVVGKYLSNARYIEKFANMDRGFLYRISRAIGGMKRDIDTAHQIASESERTTFAEYRTIHRMERAFEAAMGRETQAGADGISRLVEIPDSVKALANKEDWVYTENQYNNFGWARHCEALTFNELNDMHSKIQEKGSLRKFKQSADGEAIINVNDKPYTTLDVDNVFVFVTGNSDNPQIEHVLRINLLNETEIERHRKTIYAIYKKHSHSRADDALGRYLHEDGLFLGYSRRDSYSYQEYRTEIGKQSGRGESEGVTRTNRDGNQRSGTSEKNRGDVNYSPATVEQRIVLDGGSREGFIPSFKKRVGRLKTKDGMSEAIESLREAFEVGSVYFVNSFAAFENQLRRNVVGGVWNGKYGRMSRRRAQEFAQFVRLGEAKGLGMLTTGQYRLDGTAYDQSDSLFSILAPVLAKKGEMIETTDANGNTVKVKANGDELGGEMYLKFSGYLAMLNARDRLAQGKNPFGSMTDAEILAEISQYETKHPEFKQIAEKWSVFNKQLLDFCAEAGLISQKLADDLHAKYPFYAPMLAPTVQSPGTGSTKGEYNLEVKNGIKKAKGGDHLVADPIANYCNMVVQKVKAAHLNHVLNELYSTADGVHVIADEMTAELREETKTAQEQYIADPTSVPDAESLFRSIMKPATDGATNEIHFWADGELRSMKVSKMIYVGIQNLNKSSFDFKGSWVFDGMASVNSMYKSLITSANPFFSIKNMVRDLWDGLLHSRFPIRKFIRQYGKLGKLMAAGKITEHPMWQEFIANGGLRSSLFDSGRKKFTKASTKTGLEQAEGARKLLQTVENVNVLIEALPRFTEYVLTRNNGGSVMEALNNSAEVTTNFARSGIIGKFLNRTVMPFLNPAIQGFSKPIRQLVETGFKDTRALGQLLFRAAMLGVLPMVLSNLMYGDDEDYQDLDDSLKENNFLFKMGDTWIKIPRGRVVSVISGLYNRSEKQLTGEYVDWKDYLENVKTQATPVDSFTRTIFSPFYDVSTNTTWYGGTIENQAMQNLAPEDRYDEYTSSLAVAIGKVTGKAFDVSPKKIHYLLDQYSGVIGDLVLPLTTTAARSNPINSNFTVDTTKNSNLSDRFYDLYNETMYAKNDGDDTAYYMYRRLGETKGLVSDLYKQVSEINKSDLSNKEKLAQTAVLRATINQLYKTALADTKAYSSAIEAAAPIKNLYGVVEITSANYKKYGIEKDEIGKYAVIYNGETKVRIFSDQMSASDYAASAVQKTTYAEANRLMYGASYALEQYNASLAEKADTLARLGVDQEDYYHFYMTARYYSGTAKRKMIEQYCKNEGMTQDQTTLLLYFSGYTSLRDEVLKIAQKCGFSKEEQKEI